MSAVLPNGETETIECDAAGRPTLRKVGETPLTGTTYQAGSTQPLTITDHLTGKTETYEYNQFNQITKKMFTDETETGNQNSETFTYNPKGLLVNHTDINGVSTSYEYTDPLNRVTKETQGGLRTITKSYQGPVITTTHEESGTSTTVKVNALGEPVSQETMVDGSPRRTTIEYAGTGQGLIRTVTHGDGTGVQEEYSGRGNLLKTMTHGGITTTYSYANGGLTVTETQQPFNGDLARTTIVHRDIFGRVFSETDPAGNTTTTEFNTPAKTVTVNRPLGQTITRTADFLGRPLTESINGTVLSSNSYSGSTVTTTNRYGGSTTVERDIFGRAVRETQNSQSGSYTTTTAYTGNTVTRTLPNGASTVTALDTLYRPVSVTTGSQSRTFEYSADGLTKTETVGTRTTTTTANEAGELREIRKNGVLTASYETDYEARTSISRRYGARPYETATVRDINGFPVSTTANGVTTTTLYNRAGMPLTVTGRGRTVANAYDANYNLLSTSDGKVTTGYTYDALNRKRTESVGGSSPRTKTFQYDDLNRLTGVTTTGGVQNVNIAYPDMHTKVWQFAGQTTTFSYDDFGREVGITRPDFSTRTTAYDSMGNRQSMTDFDGKVFEYVYDDLNRLHTESVGDDQRTYTYTEEGYLAEVTTGTQTQTQTQTLTYDYAGRVKTKTFENGKTISYSYYPDGKLERITDHQGQNLYYRYNDNGKLEKILNGSMKSLVEYQYDDTTGQLMTQTHFNDTGTLLGTTEYQYDESGRIVTQRSKDAKSAEILYDGFTYDDRGNITEKIEKRGDVTFTTTYQYYKADLLESYEVKDQNNVLLEKVTYTHDDAGNRLTEVHEGNSPKTIENTYNNLNQMIESITNDAQTQTQTQTYSYDPAGRLLSSRKSETGNQNPAVATYSYNNWGQLANYSGPGGTASYSYSYNNQRISSYENGTLTDFTYHGNELFETYTGSHRVSKYVHSPMGTVGVYNATNTYNSIVTDTQNSIIGVLNSTLNTQNSTLSQSYAYSPFGGVRYQQSDSFNTSLQWLSRHYDETSGNHYLMNRYYNASTGRFNSTDWYEYVDTDMPYSMNLYQYGYGNAMTGTDADGLRTDFNYFQREKVDPILEQAISSRALYPSVSFYDIWREGVGVTAQRSLNISRNYANYRIDNEIINSFGTISFAGIKVSKWVKITGASFRMQEDVHQWLESKNYDILKKIIMSPADEFASIRLADSEKDLLDNVWVITPQTAATYDGKILKLRDQIKNNSHLYKLKNNNIPDAILYNNGVNNKLEQALETAVDIANKSQRNVILFHNPTAGPLDGPQCLTDKLHTQLLITKKLQAVVEMYMSNFGKSNKLRPLTLFSHSEGTMHSAIMLRYLGQEYKNELSVRFFGSPEYTNPNTYGVKDFKNYVNPFDVVTHLGGMMNMNSGNIYLPLNHFGFGNYRSLNFKTLLDNHSMTESYLPMYFSLDPIFR